MRLAARLTIMNSEWGAAMNEQNRSSGAVSVVAALALCTVFVLFPQKVLLANPSPMRLSALCTPHCLPLRLLIRPLPSQLQADRLLVVSGISYLMISSDCCVRRSFVKNAPWGFHSRLKAKRMTDVMERTGRKSRAEWIELMSWYLSQQEFCKAHIEGSP